MCVYHTFLIDLLNTTHHAISLNLHTRIVQRFYDVHIIYFSYIIYYMYLDDANILTIVRRFDRFGSALTKVTAKVIGIRFRLRMSTVGETRFIPRFILASEKKSRKTSTRGPLCDRILPNIPLNGFPLIQFAG